jgi:hypothetical protein
MAKEQVPVDETLPDQDLVLFDVLAAIDRKDYGYYDRLTAAQQKKIVPFVLMHWVSAVKANRDIQRYYVQSTDYHANKHFFNENVQEHPKLLWMMLCASSPGIGKQFHQWVPQIKERVVKLRENAKPKEIKEYFKKIYPKSSDADVALITQVYIETHKKKMYLADKFPTLKYDEIELLSDLITDDDIENYEKAWGN